jgi:hypothetical protein
MNNIENDKQFAQPWIAVKMRLIEKAEVPEEHLKDITVEQSVFLDDLYCVNNLDAVRKLANNKELLYTNGEVNDLFVTDIAVFLVDHFGTPENLPNAFMNDRDHLREQYEQVLHFGDIDYEAHHDDLKRLKIPDEPVKAT